jgi:hypothetical protein
MLLLSSHGGGNCSNPNPNPSGGGGGVAAAREKILVSVRVRPLSSREMGQAERCVWECTDDRTIVHRPLLLPTPASPLLTPDRLAHPKSYTFGNRNDAPSLPPISFEFSKNFDFGCGCVYAFAISCSSHVLIVRAHLPLHESRSESRYLWQQ